jgi:hypothetical protein
MSHFTFEWKIRQGGIRLIHIGHISNCSNKWLQGEHAYLVVDDRIGRDEPFEDFLWNFPFEDYLPPRLRFDLDDVSGAYLESYNRGYDTGFNGDQRTRVPVIFLKEE